MIHRLFIVLLMMGSKGLGFQGSVYLVGTSYTALHIWYIHTHLVLELVCPLANYMLPHAPSSHCGAHVRAREAE